MTSFNHYAFGAVIEKENDPDTPVEPWETWRRDMLDSSPFFEAKRWLVRDGSGIVATGWLGLNRTESNAHRAKVYGSYGRFYEQIPMDLVIRSFSYERQPRIINFSPTSTTPDPTAEADLGTASAILGGFTEPADPNLKNQYLTEILAGAEREVMPNVSVGIKGIYRNYGRVIEDFPWIRVREFAIVLALTDANEVVVERGYKHGPRVVALSFPAGYLEPGEDPLAAGKRELREEAGYEARDWTALGRYVVDGNYGCGAEHAFLARGAHRTTALPSDDLEEFEVSLLPLPDLITAWRRGEIAQLSSAAALGLALLSIRA